MAPSAALGQLRVWLVLRGPKSLDFKNKINLSCFMLNSQFVPNKTHIQERGVYKIQQLQCVTTGKRLEDTDS